MKLEFPVFWQFFLSFAFDFLLNSVDADVFSAVVKLEYLVRVEEEMIDALGKFLEESKGVNIPDSIETFLTEAREKNKRAFESHYIENPINAFHFVKRMNKWKSVFNDINCEDCVETKASKTLNYSISEIQEESSIASEVADGDVIGAAVALVRVWHTYQLDLGELFRGKIYNTTAEPLTPEDIYYICRVMDDRKMYYKEILWLSELLKQAEDGYYTGKTSLPRAYKALAGAYFMYGMPWKSYELINQYLEKDPDNKSVQRDVKFYAAKQKSFPPEERTLTLRLSEEDENKAHYEALCRGDIQRPVSKTSKLKCFLKPTESPLLFAKEEVLNYDPRVSMYHDVITEMEMDFLKSKVMERFRRSGIVGTTSDEVNDMRVSQTAWLHDRISPIIQKYTYRIQLLTGLSTKLLDPLSHAEELQILNYGIGGMYEPHPDWFGFPLRDLRPREQDPEELQGSGDRLATWLAYLNPVEAGGATVFVNLNITVPVAKGAAAFWYNIKRTGETDDRTWHAGCPVLIGSKWAANKWIRETGNIFRRKCGKTPFSFDEPLP